WSGSPGTTTGSWSRRAPSSGRVRPRQLRTTLDDQSWPCLVDHGGGLRVLFDPDDPAAAGPRSVAAQVVVDEADRHRALPARGCYPFHRPAADVADREDPGQAGLQEQGGTLERPAVRRVPARHQVGPGEHEPPPVAPDLVWQPLGAGLGSDQD